MAEIVLKNLTKDYRSNEAYKTLRTNIGCFSFRGRTVFRWQAFYIFFLSSE